VLFGEDKRLERARPRERALRAVGHPRGRRERISSPPYMGRAPVPHRLGRSALPKGLRATAHTTRSAWTRGIGWVRLAEPPSRDDPISRSAWSPCAVVIVDCTDGRAWHGRTDKRRGIGSAIVQSAALDAADRTIVHAGAADTTLTALGGGGASQSDDEGAGRADRLGLVSPPGIRTAHALSNPRRPCAGARSGDLTGPHAVESPPALRGSPPRELTGPHAVESPPAVARSPRRT
jgi:hypothetical protein